MQIRAEEISQIIRKEIEGFDQKVAVTETGTVLEAGDGIARVYGLQAAMAGELLDFGKGVVGLVLNLEEDNVGVALLGNFESIKEGDTVKRTGKIAQVPVGDALIGRVVNALGVPIDGKGPIDTKRLPQDRGEGARHHRPQVGARADADRHQGHRLDDPDRPRPARADHRRPPDRQDGGRRRHDHQPEGPEHVLLLRGHRPEAVHGGHGGRAGCARPGRWSTPPSSPPPPPSRRPCSSWPPTPASPWPSTTGTAAGTRSSSMTISPSRPSPTGSCRCCCAARPGARPTRATYSTCTPACWSGRPSCRTRRAAAR